ncbi:hypothetical protein Emed_001663 [Eimeria media]
MQAFPPVGGEARRLAETTSAGLTDGLTSEEFSEVPRTDTTGSYRDAALDKEDAVFFVRDEAHSQQSGRQDDTLEYVDKDLAGEGVPEGKTTRTTVKAKGKKARVSLDAAQWTALIAAIAMALAAGGWQLAERLELFPKPHKKVMPLPKFDFERVEALQADMQLNLERLRRAWEQTSDEVRDGFVKKLETYVQPAVPGEAAAAEKQSFDEALSHLLQPATALRSAPVPESDEEKTNLKRQLMLVNGSLNAAHVELSVMTQLKARQKQQGDGALPFIEELKAQTTDLVTLTNFLQMIAGKTDAIPAAEEGGDAPRIPRVLAQAVADYVLQSELEAVASAGKEEAFVPFIAQFEGTEGPLPDLVIPAGGRFRTEAFVNLVNHLREARTKFTSSSSESMMKLAEDFSIETAVEILDQAEDSASRREELTKRLVKEAAKGTGGSEEKPAGEDGSFYRTLLGLFDGSE